MYVKQLSENEEKTLNQRFEKIKELQEQGIIMDYRETVELYKRKMKEIIL